MARARSLALRITPNRIRQTSRWLARRSAPQNGSQSGISGNIQLPNAAVGWPGCRKPPTNGSFCRSRSDWANVSAVGATIRASASAVLCTASV